MSYRSFISGKVPSFLAILGLSVLGWTLLGYLLRFLFADLSLAVFFCIGLASGLVLARILSAVHPDPDPVPRPATESSEAKASDPDTPAPAIRPNLGNDPKLSE